MDDLILEDGKYRIERVAGRFVAYRHGEEWRDLVGDKLISAMFDEIERLRAALAARPAASIEQRCFETWGLPDGYVEAFRSGQARPAGAVPEGWKLVPVEPTDAMFRAYTSGTLTEVGFNWCRHRWAAMLAAAPQPPAQSDPRFRDIRSEDCCKHGVRSPPDECEQCDASDLLAEQALAQQEKFAAVGREMVEITTTVRGEDEWACIPGLWLKCMQERDEALTKLAQQAKAEPLSEEQIVDALVKAGLNLAYRSYEHDIECARAVERAHGIVFKE